MANKVLITPSILSADFGHLQDDIASVEPYADWLQADVMDGHFVPNLSFGAPVLKPLSLKLPLDVHLMVSNPMDRIDEFLAIKAAHITFHAEAVPVTADRKAIIARIRAGGAGAGIAINPKTPVSAIDDVVNDIDMVLVMSVNPGFSGQKFIPEVLEKVKNLRQNHPLLMIQMDGGITPETAKDARLAGCNNLVAASAIFSATDRARAIADLRG